MSDVVWEPLAEIDFDVSEINQDRVYCLCSRAFIRTKVDSWEELIATKLHQCQMEDGPSTILVNQSEGENLDLQNCSKSEVDAGSCYCSASHYSTDDCDCAVQTAGDQHLSKGQHSYCAIQNSDSGADLSEYISEKQCLFTKSDELQLPNQYSEPNLGSEWEKFWSKNGESIIWKSWIEKFGAYINSDYLEQTAQLGSHNEIIKDRTKETENNQDNNSSSLLSTVENSEIETVKNSGFKHKIESIPNVKISSYLSSSNLSDIGESATRDISIDESEEEDKILKSNSFGSYSTYEKVKYLGSDDDKVKCDNERVRSRCSNTNLSVKSIANTTVTTDSMTNVTKITLSSLDLSCDCGSTQSSLFLSSSSDESYGPCSSTSSSSSSEEEICTEADIWWRKLWKAHYDEQYESSYKKFADNFHQNSNYLPQIRSSNQNDAEGMLKTIRTSVEVPYGADRNPIFKSQQYFNSVAYCLHRLGNSNGQDDCEKNCPENQMDLINQIPSISKFRMRSSSPESYNNDDDENSVESFEDCVQIRSRRKQEIQKKKEMPQTSRKYESSSHRGEKPNRKVESVKKAMSLMGFSFNENDVQSGCVNYRKKNIRGQNRRLKLTETKPKSHIFFDDDGSIIPADGKHAAAVDENSCSAEQQDFKNFESDIVELDGSCFDSYLSASETHPLGLEDDNDLSSTVENLRQKRKRKRVKKKLSLPKEVVENKRLRKYWGRRYQLFSKFDKGIQLDAESWFSVTPEKLAKHHAERCRCDVIVDAFCGAGGNAIQFAFTCERVIAIDIDPKKIKMAKNNARIYGVEDRIEFIVGDFTKLASHIHGDVVFLSPPWGGIDYGTDEVYDLDRILPPLGGEKLFHLATSISNDVAFFLPKTSNSTHLALLPGPGGEAEIEQNFIDSKLLSITAYFGGLVMDPADPYI